MLGVQALLLARGEPQGIPHVACLTVSLSVADGLERRQGTGGAGRRGGRGLVPGPGIGKLGVDMIGDGHGAS